MSEVKIRSALETALAAIVPALATKFENQKFSVPASNAAWQEVKLVFNDPLDTEMTASYHQKRGILQIILHYPWGTGALAATSRGLLISSVFARGNTFVNGGVTTRIERTPKIGQGMEDPDHREWILPVTARFIADIFG